MSDASAEIKSVFSRQFGQEPVVTVRAPGRVEILGNHTDYNEGVVLSCAIDKYIYVALGPSDNGDNFEFYSTLFPSSVKVSQPEPQKENAWVNYPLGVYAVLQEKGFQVAPFKIAINGTVPMGAGLSSSAALEVATGLALCKAFNFSVEPSELATICQRAEHTFCGTQCGLLDQYTVLFGKDKSTLYIDFRSLDHDIIPVQNPDLLLAITTSGVTHSLSDSAYNDRRKECSDAARYFSQKDNAVNALRDVSSQMLNSAHHELGDIVYRRATHVVGENERVIKGIDLLKQGLLEDFGNLLYESHESSRTNFENSCEELDILVECARTIDGVYGSRLTGGGWGGATLTMLHRDAVDGFRKKMIGDYKDKTGKDASVHIAAITEGAKVL